MPLVAPVRECAAAVCFNRRFAAMWRMIVVIDADDGSVDFPEGVLRLRFRRPAGSDHAERNNDGGHTGHQYVCR